MIKDFFKKYGWWYIPGIAFLVINSYFKTLIPETLGSAIDKLSDISATSFAEVYRDAAKIFLLSLAVFAATFIWRYCVIGNGRRMECFLRAQFFKKLQTLPVSFFAKKRSGDLIAYAINDTGAVRKAFGTVMALGINGALTASLSIISMVGKINLKLTLLALIPVPFAVAALVLLGNMVQKRFRRVQELFANISGFVNESIMGIRVIKTFSKEKEWQQDFGKISDDMKAANVKLANISSLISPTVNLIFGLSYFISIVYGSSLVESGAISLGELVAFLSYLVLVQTPVVQLGRIINMVQRGIASYRRLNTVVNEPSIPENEFLSGKTDICGNIDIKNLSFTYDGAQKAALENISFSLKAGETLGIAGTTGCGKTTLVSLLMKFYSAPKGTIFIDGRDITEVSAADIRKVTGYVSQDGFLFSDTVEKNIEFYSGKEFERIEKAAKLADVEREIEGFPQGYSTEVGERGTHLSGGQKQRIALARALVRDPKILILDDTLSAVDNLAEREITANLNGVLKNKTSIVISHRLSALTDCDKIIYMENGEIAEQGTHFELMQQNGKYAATFNSQKEGEPQ